MIHLTTRSTTSQALVAVLFAVSALPLSLAAQTNWQRAPLLEHVRHPAIAYDAVRDVTVMFGGESSGGCLQATWLWDRTSWQHAATTTMPPARQKAAMVFDAARGVVLLFGGVDDNNVMRNDTWQYDGVAWTQLSPPQAPSPRVAHAMVFDSIHGTVVLFGGKSMASSELDDTWEWNGSTWLQRTPLHNPPRRSGAGLACDTARQRLVLFGGSCFALGPCWRNDTWEWDGQDWVDRSPPYTAVRPPGRWYHGMVYDAARATTIIFGGSDEPGHYKNDTWQWDGSVWTEVTPLHLAPSRLGFGYTFDAQAQSTLLFGGEGWLGDTSDLWAFNGNDWQCVAAPMQPPISIFESYESCAFDGDRGVVVWLGPAIPTQSMQTWEWHEGAWYVRDLPTVPPGASHCQMRWIPALHRIVLYKPVSAGVPEQTWEYDGQQWQLLAPSNQPSQGAYFSLSLDVTQSGLLLFGGRDALGLRASTWTFANNNWQQVATTGPSARERAAMTLDAARGRVVLFGGYDGTARCNDTWEWQGNQWQQRFPLHVPPAREHHAMSYDLGRRRVVMHAGYGAGGPMHDTWEWTGTDWQERAPTATTLVAGHSLLYDFWHEEHIAFGGSLAGTWRYAPEFKGSYEAIGTGCGGAAGTPQIWTRLGEQPYSDGPFTVSFSPMPGNFAFGVVGWSASHWQTLPLPISFAPIGLPGCELLVSPDSVATLPVQNGIASWTLELPAAPMLVGAEFYQQAFAFYPGSPIGVVMTGVGAGVIGGR